MVQAVWYANQKSVLEHEKLTFTANKPKKRSDMHQLSISVMTNVMLNCKWSRITFATIYKANTTDYYGDQATVANSNDKEKKTVAETLTKSSENLITKEMESLQSC